MAQLEADVDARPYRLVPLTMQHEGESYLVGNATLNRFYQLPEIGVTVIRLLQEGLTIQAVQARLALAGNADIDVEDFIGTLAAIGFAYRGDPPAEIARLMEGPSQRVQRLAQLARLVFSTTTVCVYGLVLIAALICLIRMPSVRPPLAVFFFPGHMTASLVILLVAYIPIVLFHEAGHMLAAARHGIDSHLSLGTRLWTVVIEADLTGVLSLPRNQRYLPLLAGLLADAFSVSLLLLFAGLLFEHHASAFLIQLVQALTLQTVFIMWWQTNIFLRTDLYYVLGTALAYPDLDRDARLYLGGWLYRLSLGRMGRSSAGLLSSKKPQIVRMFSLLWVIGRMLSVFFLLAVGLPTLFFCAKADVLAFRGASLRALPYDSILFTLISALLLFSGMWMWIRGRRSRTLTLVEETSR